MIATWMAAAALVGASLCLAAAMLERVLRVWRRPARGVWAAALLLAAALPLGAAVLPRAAVARPGARPAARVSPPDAATRLAAFVVRAGAVARRTPTLAAVDVPLGIAWGLASTLLACSLARSARRLARARRRWPVREVDGTPVLLSDDVGPAVVGVRRAAIVLPAWTLTLDAPLRRLIVRHEREHVRGRDPQLLALGVVAAVAMPWSPAVWWALRRLRLAAELDCDARVLAAHADASRYGLLLLAVAQRRATAPWQLSGAPALVESSSDLSRRIIAMRTTQSRHRLLTSAAASVLAALGVAGAAAACGASRDVVAPKSVAGSPPDVLKLPARTITAGADSIEIVPMRRPGQPVDATVVPTKIANTSAAPVVEPKRASSTAPRQMAPGQIYFEFQVEKPVTQAPGSPGPRYPDSLRVARTEGVVLAQFVVDTLGHAIPESYKVLKADHDLFVQAVKAALPNMRFEPALVGGRKVKQLVQQPFVFSLSK